MQITVNGMQQEVPSGTNVSQLLDFLKIPPERISVEVNLDVLDRKAYHHTSLREGDRIEIIGFVGGGADVG
ncbi:MAG: sulfur carrier protein ThiS [Nitrospiria bacterium]